MSAASVNTEILQCLQECLFKAEQMPAAHIAVSLVSYGHKAEIITAGDRMLDKDQLEALANLTKRVKGSVEQWSPPPVDENLGPSYACYNAAAWSLGFDFLVWLIDAEMYRLRHNGPAPLRVGFWFGTKPETDLNYDKRLFWYENVFRPALALIGAVEDEAAIGGRRSAVLTSRPICQAARDGEAVPRFKAPDFSRKCVANVPCNSAACQALGACAYDDPPAYDPDRPYVDQPPVTITLREAGNWEHRNSDLSAWYRFALNLRAFGERVVFIRDTAKAFEPIAGFETAPEASLDLGARMAMYQSARANLFVANGPATLAIYSDRPWLMFVPVEPEDSPYLPNRASFWSEQQGVAVGEQYPWSLPSQRLIWERASYDAICRAWAELRPRLDPVESEPSPFDPEWMRRDEPIAPGRDGSIDDAVIARAGSAG